MAGSAAGKTSKHAPNIWKEAYNELSADEKGKDRLHKLNDILRQEIGQPKLKIRSEDGYKQLQAFINKRSAKLKTSKVSEKVGKISSNMLKIEELVSAGANVGGPYVAIPAAALFMAFSVCLRRCQLNTLTQRSAGSTNLSSREGEHVRAGRERCVLYCVTRNGI